MAYTGSVPSSYPVYLSVKPCMHLHTLSCTQGELSEFTCMYSLPSLYHAYFLHTF